ncbi:MAG: SpoIIE family protein phosphatase [Halanaerobiaceae bacterium]
MSQTSYLATVQEEKRRKRLTGIKGIKIYDVFILFLAFFIGQAEIAGFYLLPFVFLTILATEKRFLFFLSLIIIFLSSLSLEGFNHYIYQLAILTGFFLFFIGKNKIRNTDIILLNSIMFLILAFIYNYSQDLLPAHYFITIAESIFLYCVCQIAHRGFVQLIDKKKNLNSLALFTIFILANGFLIGLANFDFVPFQIVNVLVMTLLIAISYVLGLNYSTLAALAFALVLIAASVIPLNNIFLYIIFAFSTSLLSDKRKIWTIIGVMIAFFLYSAFASNLQELQEIAFLMFSAFLIFMLVPLKCFRRLFSSLMFDEENGIKDENVFFASGIQEHLKQLSGVFNKLSITFSEAIPTDSGDRALDDFAFIFKSKVCGKCKRLNVCWQQEKDDIYKRLFYLLKTGEKEGFLSINNINKCFAEKCSYIKQIVSSVKVSYEIYQINNFWRNRLKDKQKIVSEQLAGMSEIVQQFSRETSLTGSKEAALEDIRKKANENQIDLYKVEMHCNANNREYFTAEMEQCSGNYICAGQFLQLINAEFQEDYRLVSKFCGNKMKDIPCRLVYGPIGSYQLKVASALKSCSSNISGDSFSHKALKDGKDLVVISDGMGVGQKASVESKAAISLLETIIDAGFDQSLAIKTINSALYLRNQEESFTTLDICIFDTFTGKITFSKIGAVASFIKRGWELIKIDSASLPAGILDKIEVSHNEIQVYPDDFVIMLTDGVMDIRDDIEDKEEWLRQLMQNSSFDKPEDMLDYMLDNVLDFEGDINDDMTMLVIKIEEVSKKSRKFKGLPRINIGK